MISMRRIALGGGFRYLMKSVAAGDGAAERSNGLARYYASSGTPPGLFVGSGLADLAGGEGVERGSVVTEEHLANMLGCCCDPVTGAPVGRAPAGGSKGSAVAGFDMTFSPSKSVSVAWALADEGTKAVIYDCHRRAVDYVLGYVECEVVHSRSGTGGVVEEDLTGVVAAAFSHWDSRSGDPQLHDHVVVWNRARSLSDGRWRTLDSRGLYRARSTLSSMHQGVLSDYLTAALGVGWDPRARRHSDRPRYEIAGVPEALMAEFSQRAEAVEARKDELIASFVAAHHRQPTGVEVIRLRQVATLATRPDKVHRSLANMTDGWRQRARVHLEGDQVAWVTGLKDRNDLPLLRAGDLSEEMLADAADAALTSVAERRATFARTNLLDDAHRLLHGVRFATPDERVTVAERVADLAAARSLMLDALYAVWKADITVGRSSLMIAPDSATAAELNHRARAERVAAGIVAEAGATLAGGQTAGVGDEIVTRQNDRLLATGRRWVKNGDRWAVTATNPDGSMAVRRLDGGPGEVVLPADYAAHHVELAYASTAHRAQGRTVESAHAIVSPTTTREVLYVSATRGRQSNRLYVDTCYDPDPATSHDGALEPQDVREVLTAVLANEGAEVSAHEAIGRATHDAGSWVTLHAEYQTIAAAAQADRWEALLDRSGLTPDQLDDIRRSDAHGPLLAAFRDAEAQGLDVETTVPKLVQVRTFAGSEDVASVLHGRVDRWAASAGSRRRASENLIADLVPRALGITDPDMARALTERAEAMEQRARALAEQAITSGASWTRRVGPQPSEPGSRERWTRAVATVTAYRERWGISTTEPLGTDNAVTSVEQLGHRRRAQAAVNGTIGREGYLPPIIPSWLLRPSTTPPRSGESSHPSSASDRFRSLRPSRIRLQALRGERTKAALPGLRQADSLIRSTRPAASSATAGRRPSRADLLPAKLVMR